MRRPVSYSLLGIASVAAAAGVAFWLASRRSDLGSKILAAYREDTNYEGLTIRYPLDETLFPPEIVAPTFRWEDSQTDADAWLVTVKFQDGKPRMNSCVRAMQWTPSHQQWETIKHRSLEKRATVAILGVNHAAPDEILSGARISISVSKDEVGAPIFYREVILPFIAAVKDPSRLRWRFGEISSRQRPPIVLENLPVCGNCHSFSAKGDLLGMDVDYANSKGSYVIQPVAEEMVLDKSHIITWDDYKREEKQLSFGLLSQISPDGKYAVSTVKDRSVFVPKPDLAFSQLFFPIQGILVVYDRSAETFKALPGADDRQFVQSNPTWSPDGKSIVFARSKVYRLKSIRDKKTVLLDRDDCPEFLEEGKTFRFDLYRIPFNDGKGGKAEPLQGASHNGMSNFFPKYSPDGKWIVFCKANSFMLLQPDSELYIIPASGGQARRLRGNTSRMNSWHSWSPNGKWLVFSSKAYTPYTQLFLTHIDQQGRSSPAVVLSQFTATDRAANIPEFVNAGPGAIKRIREQFVDDFSHLRAGHQLLQERDYRRAIPAYLRAVMLNPNNADAHAALGAVLSAHGVHDKAKTHLLKAVALDPKNSRARRNLGLELASQDEFLEAVAQYREAVRIDPEFAAAWLDLGRLLVRMGKPKEAEDCLFEAVRLKPDDHYARYLLGLVLRKQGKTAEAVEQYRKSLSIRPDYVDAHFALGQVLVNEGQAAEAEEHLTAAVKDQPDAPHRHFFLGLSLAKQNKLDSAAEAFQKELSIQPGNPLARCELGQILLRRNQPLQAEEHLVAAIKIDPGVPHFHRHLARAKQAGGQALEAIQSYRRAIELSPDFVQALDELARLYATSADDRIRNGDQAVILAERACKLTVEKAPELLDTLAAAYAETGQFDQAVATVRKALLLAEQDENTDLAGRIRSHLDFYLAEKPLREPSSP